MFSGKFLLFFFVLFLTFSSSLLIVALCLACDLNFWELRLLLLGLGCEFYKDYFFCSRILWEARRAASSGSGTLLAFSNSDLFTTKKWQGRPCEKFGYVIIYCRPFIGLTSPLSFIYFLYPWHLPEKDELYF